MLTGSSSKATDLNCNSHRQILSLSSFEFCRCNVSLRALKKYFHIVARLYNYTIFKLTSLGEALMCDSSNRRYRELLLLFRAFFFTKWNLELCCKIGLSWYRKAWFYNQFKHKNTVKSEAITKYYDACTVGFSVLLIHTRSCDKYVFTTRKSVTIKMRFLYKSTSHLDSQW